MQRKFCKFIINAFYDAISFLKEVLLSFSPYSCFEGRVSDTDIYKDVNVYNTVSIWCQL